MEPETQPQLKPETYDEAAPAAPVTEPGTDQLPVADPDLAATVSALRVELQARAASEAQVRGMLARANAELESRASNQARLDDAHAELRAALDQLREALERESARRAEIESKAVVLAAEVSDLQAQLEEEQEARGSVPQLTAELGAARGKLAEVTVVRDAAQAEAVALRAEIDRLGAELAVAQTGAGADAGLGEAEAMLVQARELTARLTRRHERDVGERVGAGDTEEPSES